MPLQISSTNQIPKPHSLSCELPSTSSLSLRSKSCWDTQAEAAVPYTSGNSNGKRVCFLFPHHSFSFCVAVMIQKGKKRKTEGRPRLLIFNAYIAQQTF